MFCFLIPRKTILQPLWLLLVSCTGLVALSPSFTSKSPGGGELLKPSNAQAHTRPVKSDGPEHLYLWKASHLILRSCQGWEALDSVSSLSTLLPLPPATILLDKGMLRPSDVNIALSVWQSGWGRWRESLLKPVFCVFFFPGRIPLYSCLCALDLCRCHPILGQGPLLECRTVIFSLISRHFFYAIKCMVLKTCSFLQNCMQRIGQPGKKQEFGPTTEHLGSSVTRALRKQKISTSSV